MKFRVTHTKQKRNNHSLISVRTVSTFPFMGYWCFASHYLSHYLFDLSVSWLKKLTFNVSLPVRPVRFYMAWDTFSISLPVRPVRFMTWDTDVLRLTICSTCPFHDLRYWRFTSHYLFDLSVSWLEILTFHVSLPVRPVRFMTWDTDVLRLTTAVRPVRFMTWDTDVSRLTTCSTSPFHDLRYWRFTSYYSSSTCPFHDLRYWRLTSQYLFNLSVSWLEILTFHVSLQQFDQSVASLEGFEKQQQ